MLFDEGIKMLTFLRLLNGFQALLGGFGLLGDGVSIHDLNVVNTVHPLCLQVSDY